MSLGAAGQGLADPLLRVLVPFAAVYLLQFVLRAVTAVAAPSIALDLALGPQALGLLTSAYFLGYAVMQLPDGALLDRFGPRRTSIGLIGMGCTGALLFALASDAVQLGLSRMLIGMGFSASLMAAFRANALWFKPADLPVMNGLVTAAGGAGAVLATTPAQLLMATFGWRALFVLLAALGLGLMALLKLAVPEPRALERAAPVGTGAAFRKILGAPLVRRLTPVAVVTQAALLAYQSLWAGDWLRTVAGLGERAAAGALLGLSAATVAGFLGLPLLARRLAPWLGLQSFMLAGAAAFCAVQTGLVLLPAAAAPWLWPIFGLTGTSSILTYALLARAMPVAIGGRTMTALNFAVFVAAFAVQALIGVVLDGAGEAAAGHRLALGALLTVEVAALGWALRPTGR
jgi:MFS family permease